MRRMLRRRASPTCSQNVTEVLVQRLLIMLGVARRLLQIFR